MLLGNKRKMESDYLQGKVKKERLAELREKALKDRNSLYNYGYRKGFEESYKIGYEKALQEVIKEDKVEMAKKMLLKYINIKDIQEITELTKEEIEEIIND